MPISTPKYENLFCQTVKRVGSYMWVSSSVDISGALWWIAFTAVHSFFFITKLFFLPRLNIPIFLPIILGWKYSCNILNYSLWHYCLRMYWGINNTSVWCLDLYRVTLCTCSIAVCCSQLGQDVTSDELARENHGTETKNIWSLSSPNKMTKFCSICLLDLMQNRLFMLFATQKLFIKFAGSVFCMVLHCARVPSLFVEAS